MAIIDDAELVAPVNDLLHPMFHSVNVTMADRLISDVSQYYPFRAYLESLPR